MPPGLKSQILKAVTNKGIKKLYQLLYESRLYNDLVILRKAKIFHQVG